MKYITTPMLLLFALTCFAQDIISESEVIASYQDTVICIENADTISPIYYSVKMRVISNGTNRPDTIRTFNLIKSTRGCPADSAQVAAQVYNTAQNSQLELSGFVGKSLQRQQYIAEFSKYGDLYESVTGNVLLGATSENLYQDYEGKYRVFTTVSNFFADIHRVPNGRWRLRQLSGLNGSPTGTQWVMNPRSRNDFSLLQFDGGGGADNYDFFRDLRTGAGNTFWPLQRISGDSGSMRIIKVQ